VRFRVWSNAPELQLVVGGDVVSSIEGGRDDVREIYVEGVRAGARYGYRIGGGGPFPDPASRFQPDGVHGLSEVIDPEFPWTDRGFNLAPWRDTIFYELHVGTFTPEGTFRAAAAKLPTLRDLGVNSIELMPVADFAGRWNWGYDGVSLYAPSRAYGRPEDFRALVDTAHGLGMAVYLDVVYNHLGPDGAYHRMFHPEYYSADRETPWGDAINFDGTGSRHVRDFFIGSALHWIAEYHVDGFRLDATHAIEDRGEPHFLAEFAQTVRHFARSLGRECRVVLEDSRNLIHLLQPAETGGNAADAVWADDFHHQVRRALAGDSDGYYMDYSGSPEDIARTMRHGWFFEGQHSKFLGRPRGTPAGATDRSRFVVCIQNHDQIGNRARGERLHHQVDPGAYRAACALLLLAPETPLLFMGQEWAASSPFLYFTDHHPELGRQVTEGRRREFASFPEFSSPEGRDAIPDPQDEAAFLRSKLVWEELMDPTHRQVWNSFQLLIQLRMRVLRERRECHVEASGEGVVTIRWVSDLDAISARIDLRGSVRIRVLVDA
jgi:maltooligosyltrehalose trehalohydrolase